MQLILALLLCGLMLRPFSLRFSLLRHHKIDSTKRSGQHKDTTAATIFGCLNFAQRRWLRDAKRLRFGVGFCKAAELAGKGTRESLSG